MPSSPDWLASLFPSLHAIAEVGKGGQKLVFSAIETASGRRVALKLYHPNTDPRRVEREIAAVRAISSPRVPSVYDTGTAQSPMGEVIWLVEEWLEGQTLRAILDQGAMSAKIVERLAYEMLDALAAAEAVSIVHRDVKPDNILVAQDSFYLLDFGLSRHLNLESATPTVNAYGLFTAGYAPPEQYRNRKPEIDIRVDLFALGVTLFEAATGANPYREGAATLDEVFARVENAPLPRIPETLGYSKSFGELVLSMTRRHASFRPRTAAAALSWLQAT